MSLSASPLGRPHLNTSSYQRSRNILGCIHSGACHLHHWYTHAGTDVCPTHTDPELCKENLQQSVSTPKKHFRYFLSCQKKKKSLCTFLSNSIFQFSSVQSLSHVRLFVTPWIAAGQASLSIANSQSLLKLMSIESVMPSSHLILCCPLLLLPLIPPRSGSFPMSQLFTWGGQSIPSLVLSKNWLFVFCPWLISAP